jgi:hypothetical protein
MRDYIKRNAILLAIGVSCAAWACGDDDDDDGGSGGSSGKGGSAGSAGSGKGGTGGTAGKGGTGGTAGKGGTGGTAGGGTGGGDAGAGAGGEDTGGEGGTDGGSGGTSQGGAGAGNDTAGAGGVAGAAAGAGGQGGDDATPGGAGGAAAGAGGAPAAATLTELCTTICGRVDAFASTASCRDAECLSLCADYPLVGDAAIDGLYHDMVSCITANLDASGDFACADSTTTGSKWSTVVSGTNECDTETCAWTCSGAYAIDPDLYTGACACDG